MQKKKLTTLNEDYFLFFSCIIIAYLTLFPILSVGITTADDLENQTTSYPKLLFDIARVYAEDTGRFYLLFAKPIYNIPYLFDNFIILKLFHFIPILFCIFLFSLIIYKLLKSKYLTFLFLILFFTFLQYSPYTNLWVSYPFYFSFSFSLILLSVILLIDFFKINKRKYLIWAGVFFFIGLLFYEIYVVYILPIVILAYYLNKSNLKSETQFYRKFFASISPWLISVVIYLIIYLSYRYYFPGKYSGAVLSKQFSLIDFLNVIKCYAQSAFPMHVFVFEQNYFVNSSELCGGHSNIILQIIFEAKPEWIVKGVITSFLFYYLINKITIIHSRKLFVGIFLSILIIYLPNIPLAITSKYQELSHMKGYVTTYFSFFGSTLLISILIYFPLYIFRNKKSFKKVYVVVIAMLIFIISVLTSFSNYYFAKDFKQSKFPFQLVDNFIKTKRFQSIPENSIIFAPSWYNLNSQTINVYNQGFDWSSYLTYKCNKHLKVARNNKAFKENYNDFPAVDIYYSSMIQANKSLDLVLTFAKLDQIYINDSTINYYADSVLIFYYSAYKNFSLSFITKDNENPSKLIINNEEPITFTQNYVNLNLKCINKRSDVVNFIVKSRNINLRSISISNLILPENQYINLGENYQIIK